MARILVVEDDRDLVEVYKDLLEGAGHVVHAVMTTADGIKMSSRLKPDLIVLDLNLPGDSGVGVISFVRNYPSIAKTKIIVVSGQPEALQRAPSISRRVEAIMTKPFRSAEFMQIINQLLLPSQT